MNYCNSIAFTHSTALSYDNVMHEHNNDLILEEEMCVYSSPAMKIGLL